METWKAGVHLPWALKEIKEIILEYVTPIVRAKDGLLTINEIGTVAVESGLYAFIQGPAAYYGNVLLRALVVHNIGYDLTTLPTSMATDIKKTEAPVGMMIPRPGLPGIPIFSRTHGGLIQRGTHISQLQICSGGRGIELANPHYGQYSILGQVQGDRRKLVIVTCQPWPKTILVRNLIVTYYHSSLKDRVRALLPKAKKIEAGVFGIKVNLEEAEMKVLFPHNNTTEATHFLLGNGGSIEIKKGGKYLDRFPIAPTSVLYRLYRILLFITLGAIGPPENTLPKIEKLFWRMMGDKRLDPAIGTTLLNVYQNNASTIRRCKIINDEEYDIKD